MRWKSQPPLFNRRFVGHLANDFNRTGSTGPHSTAMNRRRNSIVQRQARLPQHPAKVLTRATFNDLTGKFDSRHVGNPISSDTEPKPYNWLNLDRCW
jgi:hypothetical protein